MTYDFNFLRRCQINGREGTENLAAAPRFLDIQAKPQGGGGNYPLSTGRGLRQQLNTISIKPDE